MVKQKTLGPVKGKTWVIGDTHGHIKTLKFLFEKLKLTINDRIIFLGDMVDRGSGSKDIFDLVIEYQKEGYDVICVRGNHDDLMLQSYHEEMNRRTGLLRFMKKDLIKRRWLSMGGDSTMKSFGAQRMADIDPKYFDLIESMFHFVEDEQYLYVHAGFNFDDDNPFEHTSAMMWIREFNVDLEKTGGKKVVHGHTPLDLEFIKDVIRRPEKHNFVALDNGVMIRDVIGKGHLLAFETDSKELVVQTCKD